MKKCLVVYYSFSGVTRKLAEKIGQTVNGNVIELIPEKEYSFNYNIAAKEVRSEIERGYCPKLISGNEDINSYEFVFIGSPNWFKSFAPPIRTFLKNNDFRGKIVIPFCTHGGGGFGRIEENIEKECKGSKLLEGFECSSLDEIEIKNWLNEIGF